MPKTQPEPKEKETRPEETGTARKEDTRLPKPRQIKDQHTPPEGGGKDPPQVILFSPCDGIGAVAYTLRKLLNLRVHACTAFMEMWTANPP